MSTIGGFPADHTHYPADLEAVRRPQDAPTAPAQPAGDTERHSETTKRDGTATDEPSALCAELTACIRARMPRPQLHRLAEDIAHAVMPFVTLWQGRAEAAEAEAETQRLRVRDHQTAHRATLGQLGYEFKRAERYRTAWWSARIRAANMAAIMERFPDAHMRFRVLGEAGESRCADWCYACKLDTATQRAEKAEAALNRLRQLHARHECDDCNCRLCWGLIPVCTAGCTEYPCPTLRALDDPEQQGEARRPGEEDPQT